MVILLLIVFVIVILFGIVLLVGAPYVPTLQKQAQDALDLLNLRPGQTLLELGSGDGRVMRAAAARGLHVVGYELNPILAAVSYFVTWKYRKQVRIIWGDFWHADFTHGDGVFVFLIDHFMARLDRKLSGPRRRPLKLVSFAYQIPGKQPIAKKKGLYLYLYS
jgi:SAM-dependent methyltransferase